METLPAQDANILEAEEINWRLIVYPILAALVLIVGGFALYYYQQAKRDDSEAQARALTLQATTPDALVQVADQFPGTTGAILALLSSGGMSFEKKDYVAAEKSYQHAADAAGKDAVLKDSANLGVASAQEAAGHPDDALRAYLVVAQQGRKSPYAGFAYSSAARLADDKKDYVEEQKFLKEAAALGPDSSFAKEATIKLMTMEMKAKGINTSGISIAPGPAPAH